MNRCETCTHWAQDGTGTGDQTRGTCDVLSRANEADSPIRTVVYKRVSPQSYFMPIKDHTDYRVQVVLPHDFYCGLWESEGDVP
jgi:hypothetical protein